MLILFSQRAERDTGDSGMLNFGKTVFFSLVACLSISERFFRT